MEQQKIIRPARGLDRKIKTIAAVLRAADQAGGDLETRAAYLYGALTYHFRITEKRVKT